MALSMLQTQRDGMSQIPGSQNMSISFFPHKQ
jgi:hypothetical protein